MDTLNLNTILFAGKWAFIGLIYLILMLVVISVRREIGFPHHPSPAGPGVRSWPLAGHRSGRRQAHPSGQQPASELHHQPGGLQ